MNKSKINIVSIDKLTLSEFLIKVNTKVNNRKRKNGWRLRAWVYFINNNILTCPVSGLVVSYCSLDRVDHVKSEVSSTYHYNFYSQDGQHITVDHKIPKSMGGSNHFENLQPMLEIENSKKGNDLIYL